MDCKKAEKFLIDYLYQELSAKNTVEVEKHLKTCDKCTKTVESWRAIHQGFQRSIEDEPAAAPYLKQKLLIAAREELERKPSFRERFVFLLKPAILLPILIFAIATILYFPWQAQKTEIAHNITPMMPARKMEQAKQDQLKTRPELDDLKREKKAIESMDSYRDKDASLSEKEKAQIAVRKAAPSAYGNKVEDEAAKNEQRAQNAPLEGPSPQPSAPAPASPPPPASEAQPTSEAGAALRTRPEATEEKPAGEVPPAVMSKMSKENGDVYFQEAQSLFQRNDLKGGVQLNQRAVEHDGARALAVQFHQSGIQYQQSRDCARAIPQFVVIVNNYRNYAAMENVLQRLGECYSEIGQLQSARKAYGQLLQYPSSRQLASQKIQEIDKKIQTQEQLKALGYVSQ